MTVTGIEAEICQDIAARQQAGIAEYGQSVADNPAPLSTWLSEARREAQDGAIYLLRAEKAARAQEERIQALESALERCRARFEQYGDLHRAKETPDGFVKATSNYEMAEMCAMILEKP